MYYLNSDEINELATIGARVGMGQEPMRSQIFALVNRDFYLNLTTFLQPVPQVKGDLIAMDQIDYLENYDVPLWDWLKEGNNLLIHGASKDRKAFQKAVEKVALQRQQYIADDQDLPAPNVAVPASGGGGEEKVVLRNDMLDFGWLAEAARVGKSVARLTVTRYEGGSIDPDANDEKRQSFGTGWLVGPRHIITNHHVINYRSDGEGLADQVDLDLQAKSTIVQFDYDVEGEEGDTMTVSRLRAYSPRGGPPGLDYAVLELSEAVPPDKRKPLVLAPYYVTVIENDDPLPLNIIQHPGGRTKMLGIRNNLAHRLDDYDISYFTDTEFGSSGSPVCNDQWQVIALHKKYKRFVNENIMFQGQNVAWENRGTRINQIIDHLNTEYKPVWDDMEAEVVQ